MALWLLLAVVSVPAGSLASARDAQVDLGIRQWRDGDFEAAVFTLDRAAGRLAQQADKSQTAEAYLYLGAAYVGLEHESAAKAKFRDALRLQPSLRPSTTEFPPTVVRVFNTQLAKATAAKKKQTARILAIAGGVAAAGTVGIAVARQPAPPPPTNRPPVAAFTYEPAGRPIAGVTVVTFRSSSTDSDGGVVQYEWSFGEGSTSTGREPMHVFRTDGVFDVKLWVTDDKGARSEAAAGRVDVGTLTGPWTGVAFLGPEQAYDVIQTGASFAAFCYPPYPRAPDCTFRTLQYDGVIVSPRRLDLRVHDVHGEARGARPCAGEVTADLNRMDLCGRTLTRQAGGSSVVR